MSQLWCVNLLPPPVGLKLNLVDPEVTIDLQYLGVTLPLPPFPQSSAGEDMFVYASQ